MSWNIQELQHNASILYNHLCSDDADLVYVDDQGHLQVDNRTWYFRLCSSLGDYSREATDKVAVRTLRRVLNALEAGTLDPTKILIQTRNPVGLFMDEDDGESSAQALLAKLADSSSPFASTNRPPPNRKWIKRDTFGMNIANAERLSAWMPLKRTEDNDLTHEQLICRKVTVLTQMIIHGKETYKNQRTHSSYDDSDDES